MTMNRKIAKLYRTAYSTYRPYGIILQKSLLCCRVDKSFDAHESAYPSATGQIDVVGWFEILSRTAFWLTSELSRAADTG